MKKALLLFPLCLLMALGSCSKEQPNDDAKHLSNDEYKITFRINIPSATTKALGDTFESGASSEYYIDYNRSYLVFYSAEKMLLAQHPLSAENTEWSSVTTNENVTSVGTVKFKSNVKPKYVVCLLNRPYELDDNLNLSSLSKYISGADYDQDNNYGRNISIFAPTLENSGFYMTNSTYYTEQGSNKTIVKEIELDDSQIAEVTENSDPDPTPVDIHVERVVAKVTVEDAIEDHTIINDNKTIKIDLLGWTLNATNKSFSQIKNIDPNTADFNKFSPLSKINWNSIDNHRSYWAVDDNYNSVDPEIYATNFMFKGVNLLNKEKQHLNYYSLNETFTPLASKTDERDATPMYCFDNTVAYDVDLDKRMNAITHIIVKAKYTATYEIEIIPPTPPTPPEDVDIITTSSTKGGDLDTYIDCGETDIFRLDGSKTLYSYYDFKSEICTRLANLLGETIELDWFSINITRDAGNYYDRTDVKPVISYTGDTSDFGEFADRMDNLNELLFPGTQAWVYPEGVCYYVVPIYQYRNTIDEKAVDYYGVVRNHWYKVQLTDIIDFGEPADPGKPIIPEPRDEKSYKIESKVKVLSWAIVDQSAVLDR